MPFDVRWPSVWLVPRIRFLFCTQRFSNDLTVPRSDPSLCTLNEWLALLPWAASTSAPLSDASRTDWSQSRRKTVVFQTWVLCDLCFPWPINQIPVTLKATPTKKKKSRDPNKSRYSSKKIPPIMQIHILFLTTTHFQYLMYYEILGAK